MSKRKKRVSFEDPQPKRRKLNKSDDLFPSKLDIAQLFVAIYDLNLEFLNEFITKLPPNFDLSTFRITPIMEDFGSVPISRHSSDFSKLQKCKRSEAGFNLVGNNYSHYYDKWDSVLDTLLYCSVLSRMEQLLSNIVKPKKSKLSAIVDLFQNNHLRICANCYHFNDLLRLVTVAPSLIVSHCSVRSPNHGWDSNDLLWLVTFRGVSYFPFTHLIDNKTIIDESLINTVMNALNDRSGTELINIKNNPWCLRVMSTTEHLWSNTFSDEVMTEVMGMSQRYRNQSIEACFEMFENMYGFPDSLGGLICQFMGLSPPKSESVDYKFNPQ